MNANEILDMIGDAKGTYLWETQKYRDGTADAKPLPRLWLVAAVIGLMLLLVGCTVAYVLRLQDLKVAEYRPTTPTVYDENGDVISLPTLPQRTQITLQGANQEALAEWNIFCRDYDPDGAIVTANDNNELGIPNPYYIPYGCYSWEMVNTSKDESNGLDAEGAAVIVMKVKTGEILACASYPTYNLATMNQDWAEIEADPLKPFFNRAFGANYAPGSTFKMCTLIAAMEHRSTNPKSEFFGRYLYLPGEIIRDQGVFTKYPGFSPTCLIWTSNPGVTHGELTAQRALEVSCNYFFYELGSRMTIEMLNETANGLGLGVPTGIELTEKVGWVTDEASKKAAYGETGVNSQITAGDRVLAAIGQAENRFSPLQLCVYASTLANKGTRMKATFLSRMVASDYSSLIKENSPEIMSQMEIASTTYNTYIEGMRLVIAGGEGTARSHFGGPKDLDTFPVAVCGKTGTAQHSSGGSDHGAFICFAPMEDPEIAVAVYGEKAAHGATLAAVAEDILRAYFAMEAASEVNAFENQAS